MPYSAQKFVASSPKAEIHGSVVVGILNSLKDEDIQPVLQKHNLTQIDVSTWCPQQVILDFDKALYNADYNSMENLVAIGMSLVDSMPFDASITTIDGAIKALDIINKQVQRNIPDNEGFAIPESTSNRSLVISNTPFPDELVYGYLWSIARRFRPTDADFVVKQIENKYAAQHPGTAYEITWGKK